MEGFLFMVKSFGLFVLKKVREVARSKVVHEAMMSRKGAEIKASENLLDTILEDYLRNNCRMGDKKNK
ncbi:MAG: hypothetical protein N2746_04885 [Deltaproteobacteria bacterium]|nr:hypothetical protein [Deltaproteobacteria bacterium]